MTSITIPALKAIILGIVEGITEFLPISSTGHLILVNRWISFSQPFTTMFDIVIQLGAILAVVVYFWQRLWPFDKDTVQRKAVFAVWLKTIVGVIPAIILGGLLGSLIENKLFNPWVVSGALIAGGAFIIFIEKKEKDPTIVSISDLSFKTVFLIGLAQCVSMIPGVSRSAATTVGAMILGASRVVATEFSFFLAIPTMFAASVYSLLKYEGALSIEQIFILAVGFIISFIVALAVVKFLIRFVERNNFKIFGYYRILLGLIVVAYFLLR